jgi:heme exporter protein D
MSLSEALDMGKYAGYVWGSYGVTLVCLLAEVVWLRLRRRTILRRLGRIMRITTRQQHETQT